MNKVYIISISLLSTVITTLLFVTSALILQNHIIDIKPYFFSNHEGSLIISIFLNSLYILAYWGWLIFLLTFLFKWFLSRKERNISFQLFFMISALLLTTAGFLIFSDNSINHLIVRLISSFISTIGLLFILNIPLQRKK